MESANSTHNASKDSRSPKDSQHEKIDSTAERVHEAVERAAEMAGTSEERLMELAEELRAHADRLAKSARKQSAEVTSAVEDYTRENPIKTISLAFLLGAMLAFLFRK
jgi:ElaB/YqjD/DUF883 family membrane-anchored ribosome-binding protein